MAEHALALDISIFRELLDLWVVSSPHLASPVFIQWSRERIKFVCTLNANRNHCSDGGLSQQFSKILWTNFSWYYTMHTYTPLALHSNSANTLRWVEYVCVARYHHVHLKHQKSFKCNNIFFLDSSLRIIISVRESEFKTKKQMLTALLARDPPW